MRRAVRGPKGRPLELGFGPRGRKGDREDREESTGGSEKAVVADEFDFGDSGRAVGQGVAEAAHAFGRPADEDPPGPARGADGADSDEHDEDHGAHDEDIDAQEGHEYGDGGYHDHVLGDGDVIVVDDTAEAKPDHAGGKKTDDGATTDDGTTSDDRGPPSGKGWKKDDGSTTDGDTPSDQARIPVPTG